MQINRDEILKERNPAIKYINPEIPDFEVPRR